MLVSLLVAFGLSLIFCNIVEYIVHSEFMHKKRRGFESAKETHDRQHHGERIAGKSFFKGDDDLDVKEKSRMGWLLLIMVPVAYITYRWWGIEVSCVTIATAVFYVVAYEKLHEAMHPHYNEDRWIHRFWLFKWLCEHHRIHHVTLLKRQKNFNVMFPLTDLLAFTLSVSPIEPEKQAPPHLRGLTGPLSTLPEWLQRFLSKVVPNYPDKKAGR